MHIEQIVIDKKKNVTLTAYLQEVGGEFGKVVKRPAMLILPGGGYQYCSDREADPIALPYLKAGYQAFVLRYSVAEHQEWPAPLKDYEAAMELIRKNAETWAVMADKVAVIGFSAGGHLAAAAAVMSEIRPAAALLGYPVTGEDVKGCCPSAPDLAPLVDYKTPPCFIFATRTDRLVPIQNSLKFMTALADKGIHFESHIYGNAPHGFSSCDSSIMVHNRNYCSRTPHWVQDSIEWLKDVLGDFNEKGLSRPTITGRMDANDGDRLSIYCTISRILTHPEGQEIFDEYVAGGNQDIKNMSISHDLRLVDLMNYEGMSDDARYDIENRLNRIIDKK